MKRVKAIAGLVQQIEKTCDTCANKQSDKCEWCFSAEYEDGRILEPSNWEAKKGEIKDSGDRTQFYDKGGKPIGVRDLHDGKGRMDLMPCTAIIELSKHCENGLKKYPERSVDKGIPQHSFIDSGLRHLFKYLRGDRDENHLVAALWNIAWAVEQDVTKPELNDIPSRKESEG
jgi:hypothetical protein